MSNAKVVFNPKSYAYTGKEITPSFSVTIGTVKLVKDTDFTGTVQNGINPGTATVVIEAKPGNSKGYVGSKTATFKITGTRTINDNADITFDVTASVPFAKGGSKAFVIIKDGEAELKEGRDYALSYSKNKGVTTGDTAEVKIKGKGNYKGSVTKKFAITKQKLSALESNVIIADQFTTKDKLKKPSVTITDLDGKKLSDSKDYVIEKIDAEDASNTDKTGVVKVTIKAKDGGNYEGGVNVSFHYMEPSANISKAKAAGKIPDQDYTGNAVKLSNAELTGILTAKDKTGVDVSLVSGKHFTVTGYANNVKKGTAKVTVRGIGDFAGTKTLTFKIVQKKVDYKGALVGDGWK